MVSVLHFYISFAETLILNFLPNTVYLLSFLYFCLCFPYLFATRVIIMFVLKFPGIQGAKTRSPDCDKVLAGISVLDGG